MATKTKKKASGASKPAARKPSAAKAPGGSTQPHVHQRGEEVQAFTQLRSMPIGLDDDVRSEVAQQLNAILADTRILHDMYKKVHWLMRGPTFIALHELMDKHAEAQTALIDNLAERIQTLGAIAVGDPRHVAELTSIERPPDGAEAVPVQLSRLLEAHESIIIAARRVAALADEKGDSTTDDLLASEVVPVNELQVWFVAEHLVDVTLVTA